MSLTIRNAYGEVITDADVRVEDKGSHKIARVKAIGYKSRTVVLKGAGKDQTSYLGFDLDKVHVPDIESLEAAAATNFHAAMRFAPVYGTTLGQLVLAPLHAQQDRIFYHAKAAVTEEHIDAFNHTEAWTTADSSLHHGPPGELEWTNKGGWKQAQAEPGIQAIVWWSPVGGYVFEVDIDEHKDIFGHAYEVLRNHTTGRLTHPHVINQALARKRGVISYRLRISYRLEPAAI